MIDEPRGASLCRSSTLSFFVDFDPFHGLLLAVLGSQSDFHGFCALKCRSSTIAVWDDSGPFLRLLLSHRGPEMISTIYEPRVVFTCRSAALTILANSNVFCGLLLTVFRSRSDFHSC